MPEKNYGDGAGAGDGDGLGDGDGDGDGDSDSDSDSDGDGDGDGDRDSDGDGAGDSDGDGAGDGVGEGEQAEKVTFTGRSAGGRTAPPLKGPAVTSLGEIADLTSSLLSAVLLRQCQGHGVVSLLQRAGSDQAY